MFAAIDPPDAEAAELVRWARTAARTTVGDGRLGLRVLGAATLHLTLMFLGERPLVEVGDLAAAIAEAADEARRPVLETGAPVWLPPRSPRALAIEVRDEDGELERLQRGVARRLEAITGEAPPRRFRAHITVARTRGREGGGAGAGVLPPTPRLGFSAGEVLLYRSYLEPDGARYEALASAALHSWSG
jgi:2'-5' RNA ligase